VSISFEPLSSSPTRHQFSRGAEDFIVGPGEGFGELSLLLGIARSGTARAAESDEPLARSRPRVVLAALAEADYRASGLASYHEALILERANALLESPLASPDALADAVHMTAGFGPTVSVEPGEVIVGEGETSASVFVVVSGAVSVAMDAREGAVRRALEAAWMRRL
jgi:CRP-like cAMP-binding protein